MQGLTMGHAHFSWFSRASIGGWIVNEPPERLMTTGNPGRFELTFSYYRESHLTRFHGMRLEGASLCMESQWG